MNDPLEGITWLGHSGILIEGSRTVYVDPFEIPDGLPKADLVLLTHAHYDHCSPADVGKLLQPKTILVGPEECLRKFPGAERIPMASEDEREIAGLTVKAVPAFTARRPHHSKEKGGLGFSIAMDGRVIYHAGDTDSIRERPPIPADIAFLPVDNLFTMGPEEAVAAARHLEAGIFVPIHFGSVCGRRADAGAFVVQCRQAGLKADVIRKTRFGRPQQTMPDLSPRLETR
jgi:L-ascorbate metabolism protein UlaG (beta-lactamase superfamily)